MLNPPLQLLSKLDHCSVWSQRMWERVAENVGRLFDMRLFPFSGLPGYVELDEESSAEESSAEASSTLMGSSCLTLRFSWGWTG